MPLARTTTWVLLVGLLAPAAARERLIYLRNHSERPLRVELSVEGFEDGSWRQEALEVPAGSRALVARLETGGVARDATGEVRVRVAPGGHPLELKARFERGGKTGLGEAQGSWRTDEARVIARRPLPNPDPAGAPGALCSEYWRQGGALEWVVQWVPPRAPDASPDTLRVLSWNLWLRPETLFGDAQEERSRWIPDAARGYDAVVFQEAFSDPHREKILAALREEYPWQTEVVGRDRFLKQDGGVVILSRWPIARSAQRSYTESSGGDSHAEKGVMYVCLTKGPRRYHLFGTHTQSGPGDDAEKVAIRSSQFRELRAFMAELAIPSDEPVLFAGDLNVDLTVGQDGAPAGELAGMLADLGAGLPAERDGGLPFSYDTELNPLGADEPRQWLDYVLWAEDHPRPRRARLETRLLRSPRMLEIHERPCWDLSDHFAVEAILEFGPEAPAVAPAGVPPGTLAGQPAGSPGEDEGASPGAGAGLSGALGGLGH